MTTSEQLMNVRGAELLHTLICTVASLEVHIRGPKG